jgi:hypothetical protein
MDVSAAAPPTRLQRTRLGFASLRVWPAGRWGVAIAVTLLAGLAMGVPTGIVHTSFYTRMTPVTWWDYPVWAASALLVGLTAATYVRSGGQRPAVERSGRTIGAALLSSFAVGCPICNKLIVALIGVSGALSYWAPLQPVLGVLSIVLLATGLAVRLQGDAACRRPLT